MAAIAALTLGSRRTVTDTSAPPRIAAADGGVRRRTPSPPAAAAWPSTAASAAVLTVARASATIRSAPRGDPHAPLRSRCATITGARACGGDGGDQRVQPTDPGVAEPGALFGVAVHLDDGVVDIDQHPAVDAGRATCGRAARPGRPGTGTRRRRAGGHDRSVNARRNDPNVEGAYGRAKTVPIAAVPQQGHVVDAVGAGDHPRDQRGAPSLRRWRPCRSARSGAHRPSSPGPPRRPAPPPGPAPRTTPDSGRRSTADVTGRV